MFECLLIYGGLLFFTAFSIRAKACELRHDMDAGYHQEFLQMPAATDVECCSICANNTRCGYASWDKPKGVGKCYLKTGSVATPVPTKGHSLCVCTLAPSPSPILASGIFAFLGIAEISASAEAGIHSVIGNVEKSPSNPLFSQTEPWEKDINNG